jgi:hypothetical protein
MKDYLAIIGYACLNEGFRADLLDQGRAAVEAHNLDAELTTADELHLNEFKNATPDEKDLARLGFAAARVGLVAVCKNPPCPYSPGPNS